MIDSPKMYGYIAVLSRDTMIVFFKFVQVVRICLAHNVHSASLRLHFQLGSGSLYQEICVAPSMLT